MWKIAAILLMTASANAAPVTYSCTLVHGNNQPGMYGQVDQVVIDREAEIIDLRVAKSMGTSTEVNWLFMTRTMYDGTPERLMMQTNNLGELIAAGMTVAGSYAFKLSGEYLSFGVAYTAPAMAFTWKCEE